jgi:ubiquitin-activating enzyme E1
MENKHNMDKKQKLRYSRQIKTYGRDMQQKLMQMRYMIYGARGLGVEVAKHLILNGVNTVHICDPSLLEVRDFSANYFIRDSQVGQNLSRADASISELKKLNNGVDVKVVSEFKLENILSESTKNYDAVIITEAYGLNWDADSSDDLNVYNLNNILRKNQIAFMLAETGGLFGYLFNDFGDVYRVQSTGIEEEQIVIKDMTYEPDCIISTRARCSDYFAQDDVIEFLNLEGSRGIHMINEKEFNILEIIGKNKIRINCDTSQYWDFRRGAKLSLKKRGETMNFFPLEIASEDPKNTELCGQKKHLFFAKLLLDFRKKHNRSTDITIEDSEEMFEIGKINYFSIFNCMTKPVYSNFGIF